LLAEPDERNGWRLRVLAENAAAASEAEKAGGAIFPAYARPREFAVGAVMRTALGTTVRR
jgi:hypothetical protein